MPVEVQQTEDGANFSGFFHGGDLTVKMAAQVDANFRIKQFQETMSHSKHGVLFDRVHALANGQIAMRYDFGKSVEGPKSLVMIGERTAKNTFIYGTADGNDLFPIRRSVVGCDCCGVKDSDAVMMDMGKGRIEPVGLTFPDEFIEGLPALIPTINKEIIPEQYTAENIQFCFFAGCFWGTVACEVGAKACILGGGGTPVQIVACLAAEVACLLALDESKSA